MTNNAGKRPDPPPEPSFWGEPHPLLGAGLHYCDDEGVVKRQAAIVAVVPSHGAEGDLVWLQYFEWVSGAPSRRRLVRLAELASSERWVLYRTLEEMNDHYERVDRHRIAWREREAARKQRA
jgi:hypothetical protein